MAASKSGSKVRRTAIRAKEFFADIDIPEAVLFGLGGYFAGPVLDQTGIAGILHDKFPNTIGKMGDAMWQQTNGAKATGEALSKAAGLGLLAYEANEARQHKLSRANKSSVLPLMVGLIVDGPEKAPGASTGGSWGGSWG